MSDPVLLPEWGLFPAEHVAHTTYIRTADGESPAVAKVCHQSWTPEEIERHSHLLKSAPKLLAALLHIVNDTPVPGEDAVLSVDGYNLACAAIAEAWNNQETPVLAGTHGDYVYDLFCAADDFLHDFQEYVDNEDYDLPDSDELDSAVIRARAQLSMQPRLLEALEALIEWGANTGEWDAPCWKYAKRTATEVRNQLNSRSPQVQPRPVMVPVVQAAELATVSPELITHWCESGRLPCYHTENEGLLIPADALLEFFQKHGIPTHRVADLIATKNGSLVSLDTFQELTDE